MAALKIYIMDDDDEEIIEIATALLEARGHRVKSSVDAIASISEVASFRPHCVITDLMMPGLDGEQYCDELRKRPELKNTRLVMCSARQSDHWADRARAHGVDAYIKKPLDPDTFAQQIESIVHADG